MNLQLNLSTDMLLRLIENLTLLLSLAFIYSLIRPASRRLSPRGQAILQGLVFGVAAALVMLTPIEESAGFRFDGRQAMVALATVYGGAISGIISGAIIIAIRTPLGGAGVVSTIGAVLTVILVCTWYTRRYRGDARTDPRRLALLGMVTAVVALAWVFVNPFEQAVEAVRLGALPLLVLMPASMAFIAMLLNRQARQQALETALRESEHRLRQIADASQQMLWIYDPDAQRPLYVSPAFERIWGRPMASVYANSSVIAESLLPEDRDRVVALMHDPSPDGALLEMRILRPDGSERWLSVHLQPIVDDSTGRRQVVGTVDDITERRQAEAQRLDLEFERKRGDMLRQFINDASHDLRTPVTIMNTSLYLLGRTLTADNQRDYLSQVQIQVNRMSRLIEDLLTITDLDSPDRRFELRPVRLNAVAGAAYDRRLPETQQKDRTLTSDLTDAPLWVAVDEAEIAKAVDRVMKNAVAYTSPGGHIHISTYQRGDSGVIEVRDDGIGIGAEDLPHVFERFYRADRARGTQVGGAGLGLAIAYRALQLHGGDMEVDSQPGQGSVLRFILPLVTPPDAASPSAAVASERRFG